MPRFYAPCELAVNTSQDLPESTVRHMQVLRLQPGDTIELFNGRGGEYQARVLDMGRQHLRVLVLNHLQRECEAARVVELAVCMPANDRMDWLVEKATELGVARIWPLMSARSVLRLEPERAQKKQSHWHAIAAHACAQCGRNRLPEIAQPQTLSNWLNQRTQASVSPKPWLGLLSLAPGSQHLSQHPWPTNPDHAVTWLIGPEGGLTPQEEQAALGANAHAVHLGARILRVETAALVALAALVTSPADSGA